MRLFTLLTLSSSVSAFANIALRFDQVLKRATNDTLVEAPQDVLFEAQSVSTSEIITEVPTVIPTVDANGVPTTIYTTTTITYFTTIVIGNDEPTATPVQATAATTPTVPESTTAAAAQSNQQQSVITSTQTSTEGDTTITSLILTTITLPDESVTTNSAGQTIINKNALNVSPTSSIASGSSNDGTVTVTETVYPSTCADLTSTQIPVVATFTLTGPNGDVFTVSTSTNVDQTTTVSATSTVYPTITPYGNSTVYSTIDSTTTYPSNNSTSIQL